MLPRKSLVVLLLLFLLTHSVVAQGYRYTPPERLNDGISVGTLKDARLDEAKITAATDELLKETYPNIHTS